jgi:hypothetical protein
MPFPTSQLSGMPSSSFLRGEGGSGGNDADSGATDMYSRGYGVYNHGYHGHHHGYCPPEDVKLGSTHNQDDQTEWASNAATPGTYDADSPMVVDCASRLTPASDAYPSTYAAGYDPLPPWNAGGGTPAPFSSSRGYGEHHGHADQGSQYDFALSMVHAAHQQQQHMSSVAAAAATGVTVGGGFVPRLPYVVGAPVPVALQNGFPVLGSSAGVLPPPPPPPSLSASGLLGTFHHHHGQQQDQLGQQYQNQQDLYHERDVKPRHSERALTTPPPARTPALSTATTSLRSVSSEHSGPSSASQANGGGSAARDGASASGPATTAADRPSTASPLPAVLAATSAPSTEASTGALTAAQQQQLSLPAPPNMHLGVPHAWPSTLHHHGHPLGPFEPFSFAPAHAATTAAGTDASGGGGGEEEEEDDDLPPLLGCAPSRTLSGPATSPSALPRGSPPPMSAFTHSFNASGRSAGAAAATSREEADEAGSGGSAGAGTAPPRSRSYGGARSPSSSARGRGGSASRAGSAGLAAYRMGSGQQVPRRRRRRSLGERAYVPVKLEDVKVPATLAS